MDGIAEFLVEVIGAIVRELCDFIFGRIARFIGFIFRHIRRPVGRFLNSNALAIPVTLLLMVAVPGGLFFALVKAIQWLTA